MSPGVKLRQSKREADSNAVGEILGEIADTLMASPRRMSPVVQLALTGASLLAIIAGAYVFG